MRDCLFAGAHLESFFRGEHVENSVGFPNFHRASREPWKQISVQHGPGAFAIR
jgi:hypothetical protein